MSKTIAKKMMHEELKKFEIRIKLMQQLTIAHGRFDDMRLDSDGTIFSKSGKSMMLGSLGSGLKARLAKKISGESPAINDSADGSKLINSGEREDRSAKLSTMKRQRRCYEFSMVKIEKFIDDHVDSIYEAITEGKKVADIYYERMKVDWKIELMYIPFAPKEPLSHFADKGGSIFMSKKKPLLIVSHLANEYETEVAVRAQYAYKQAPTADLVNLESIEEEK